MLPGFFSVGYSPVRPYNMLIIDRQNTLMIELFMNEPDFTADADEIQLYAYDQGDEFIFQTVNYNRQDMGSIKTAVSWYAATWLNSPLMDFLPAPQ